MTWFIRRMTSGHPPSRAVTWEPVPVSQVRKLRHREAPSLFQRYTDEKGQGQVLSSARRVWARTPPSRPLKLKVSPPGSSPLPVPVEDGASSSGGPAAVKGAAGSPWRRRFSATNPAFRAWLGRGRGALGFARSALSRITVSSLLLFYLICSGEQPF